MIQNMALTCVTLQQRAQTQKTSELWSKNEKVRVSNYCVSLTHTHAVCGRVPPPLHPFLSSKVGLDGAAISAATWSFCLLHGWCASLKVRYFLQCTRGQIEMRVSRAASLFWAASPSTWIRICVDKQKQHHLLTDSRRSSVWSAVKELEHTGLSAGCVDGWHT